MLERLTVLYDAYVDMFRRADGELPSMMRLKREHTDYVIRNTERIAEGENFTATERETALSAALLHDTGRYEQLRRFNTFKDSDSIDHAVFSHDIVVERGWLDEVCAGERKDAVLKAVLYHNRRDLPAEIRDPSSAGELRLLSLAANSVRDADKLDIFRVLEDRVANTDWKGDSRAFWNLSVTGRPNPVVVANIEHGEPVDYQNIKTLSDFVLIQVGWMVSELAFATSRRLCAERGHLEFRRAFLHDLSDDPAVDRICDMASAALMRG